MTDKKTQRWQIWLIVGLPVLVMVLARVLVPATEEERTQLLDVLGTRNNGVLIDPAVMTVDTVKLQTLDGTPWLPSAENSRWKLVVYGGEDCAAECQQSLYITRQIHKLIPKRSNRLERIYIGGKAPAGDFAETLVNDYPGVLTLFDSGNDFDRLLDRAGVPEQRAGFYYLLDSRGYLIMYYTPKHSHKQVIKDLKVLL